MNFINLKNIFQEHFYGATQKGQKSLFTFSMGWKTKLWRCRKKQSSACSLSNRVFIESRSAEETLLNYQKNGEREILRRHFNYLRQPWYHLRSLLKPIYSASFIISFTISLTIFLPYIYYTLKSVVSLCFLYQI